MFPKPSSAPSPRIPPVEFSRKDRLALGHIKTQGVGLLHSMLWSSSLGSAMAKMLRG